MMDFALNGRDLEIANGDFSLCRDETHALAQAISIRLKTFAGEWFLDTRVGLPYLSQILGKKHSERLLRKLIEQEIKSLPSTVAIKDLTVENSRDDRGLAIGFAASLPDERTIAINETIGG